MQRSATEATVKTFSTEKKAEQWARAFDYARGLLGLPPLKIYQRDDGDWLVETSVEAAARVAKGESHEPTT